MELSLEGKIALITGASRGIGKATAERFSSSGAKVMITSRKAEAIEAVAKSLPGEAHWFQANAGDEQQAKDCVAACMDRFGGLDILVNNAATNPYMGPMLEIDKSRADKTYQVNQWGPLLWTKLAWEAAMKTRGGVVVNLSSVGGISVEPGIGWYNVSKAAVIHITKQLAVEMAPKVRVNAVAPGLVKTYMAKAIWENAEDYISSILALGRIGEPDDIAKAVLFLASDASSWMTGHIMVVDGGALLGMRGGVS
ncbi:MAG: SDR family oxidoreductase [Actinobacteria bacterium]|nr:SDR family oxidoreductase [Actinomycetota bacterium]MCL6104208.1 SDR family oxidoreductase [Actinomycetota bacterium]